MFGSMAWADGQSIEALRAYPDAQAEGLPLLAHLLAAEHIWLARLERREVRLPVRPSLSIDACEVLAASNAAGFADHLDRLGEHHLAYSLRYWNGQGREFVTSVLDILTHVVTHGAYHRGQVARVIGRSGGIAPDTDFITFAREIEPTGARGGRRSPEVSRGR
jgi:uncharacterized damage-inducible protein DinB